MTKKRSLALWGGIVFCLLCFVGCRKTYAVHFFVDDVCIHQVEVKKQGKVEKPLDPVKEGYHFLGWYLEDELYDFERNVQTSFALIARFEISPYTITLQSQNGQEDIVFQATLNETITLPTPTKERCVFLGWKYKGEFVDSVLQVQEDMTLTAEWEQTSYLVQFDTMCDKVVRDQIVEKGNKVYPPNALLNPGYTFLYWAKDGERYDFDSIVETDMTLTAVWELKMFGVEWITGTSDAIDSFQVAYGTILEEPQSPMKEGYIFVGWYYLGELFDFTTPIYYNMIFTAGWDMNQDTLENYLQGLVPEVTTSDLMFQEHIDDSLATLVWQSSNEDVISANGVVTRQVVDCEVDITVQVSKDTQIFELKWRTLVPKIELKPVNKGSIVSGYLYDYNGTFQLPSTSIEQLDYIHFSFASINNGELVLPNLAAVRQVLSYRQQGVRVGLAIGGWGAGGFSEAMLTKEGRSKLIQSIMNTLKQYQFDGIDIDWEYPTSSVAGIGSNKEDKQNLNLFCEELKQAMNAYRQDLILSIAVTTSDTFFDFRTLNQYVDIFNVMTYDYAMGNTAYHDSALYRVNASSSMSNAVEFMKARVDADKIVPGAAFYARRGTFASMTNQNLSASLSTSMGNNPLSFAKLKALILTDSTYVEQYDAQAEAAYIIRSGVFYSYDNERSIQAKCNYVKNQGLGGLMCWDLTQDYNDQGTGILVNAMYTSLKQKEE